MIINNNSSLAFGMRAYFFVKSLLNKEMARNFKFIYLSERSQPTPIFSDREISDLHRSPRIPDQRLGAGAGCPLSLPVATPMNRPYSPNIENSFVYL